MSFLSAQGFKFSSNGLRPSKGRIMPRFALVFLLFCLATLASAADQRAEAQVQQTFPAGGRITLELAPGGYTIHASDSNEIVVTCHAPSDESLRDVKATIQVTGSLARVTVSNTPHNNFRADIDVPRQSGLKVRMFAGEVIIDGVEGDKDVELTSGRIEMRIPNPGDYGQRDASVTAGRLAAGAFNIEKGGLFRSFEQNGHGKYRLHAHVTTGEIQLRGSD